MDDSISRQKAIDAICMEWCGVKNSGCQHVYDIRDGEYRYCDGCDDVDVIKALPLTKCEEREKVGRWIYHSNSSFGINPEDAYCSRCGFHVYVVDVEFDDYKYCPKCGAKMEESNG